MKSLVDLTGSGWKGYLGGLGLMLLGVCLGIDAMGIDLPLIEGNFDAAVTTFFLGLSAFGIRHKQSKG